MAEEPLRGGSILARASQPGWRSTSVELIRDGYLAVVVQHRPPRWRWAVSPLVVVERIPTQVVQNAFARGYTKSMESAMQTAEAAVEALKASLRDTGPGSHVIFGRVPCPASVYDDAHSKACAICRGSGECTAEDANRAIKKAWMSQ